MDFEDGDELTSRFSEFHLCYLEVLKSFIFWELSKSIAPPGVQQIIFNKSKVPLK